MPENKVLHELGELAKEVLHEVGEEVVHLIKGLLEKLLHAKRSDPGLPPVQTAETDPPGNHPTNPPPKP